MVRSWPSGFIRQRRNIYASSLQKMRCNHQVTAVCYAVSIAGLIVLAWSKTRSVCRQRIVLQASGINFRFALLISRRQAAIRWRSVIIAGVSQQKLNDYNCNDPDQEA